MVLVTYQEIKDWAGILLLLSSNNLNYHCHTFILFGHLIDAFHIWHSSFISLSYSSHWYSSSASQSPDRGRSSTAHLAGGHWEAGLERHFPDICNLYHGVIEVNLFGRLKDVIHSYYVNTGADVLCIAKKFDEKVWGIFAGRIVMFIRSVWRSVTGRTATTLWCEMCLPLYQWSSI